MVCCQASKEFGFESAVTRPKIKVIATEIKKKCILG